MAQKLREPKIPRPFIWLFDGATRALHARRYRGIANLPGIIPTGPVTDESQIEYYTDKVQRTTNKVEVNELEAKSAIDDVGLKRIGTAVFFAMVAASVLCIFLDETFAHTNVIYTRPANIAVTVLTTLVLNGALFMTMRQNFLQMDQNWGNSIDSFYGTGAKRQMEAVRDSMREFKRFLKWRRYMRLVLVVAVAAVIVEGFVLYTADKMPSGPLQLIVPSLPAEASWSLAERLFSAGFLASQAIWLALYWWMYVYYTTFRDPTLHMAVLVNVMDRLSSQPIIHNR